MRVDTDGDGLGDGAEDLNANGEFDEGETDPRLIDSDGGGENDDSERTAGEIQPGLLTMKSNSSTAMTMASTITTKT